MCIECVRLEETKERLTTRLQEPVAIEHSSNVIEFATPTDERVLRTAIFSLDIDLAYHRARCADYRTSQHPQSEVGLAA